jgi:hypothetical protein
LVSPTHVPATAPCNRIDKRNRMRLIPQFACHSRGRRLASTTRPSSVMRLTLTLTRHGLLTPESCPRSSPVCGLGGSVGVARPPSPSCMCMGDTLCMCMCYWLRLAGNMMSGMHFLSCHQPSRECKVALAAALPATLCGVTQQSPHEQPRPVSESQQSRWIEGTCKSCKSIRTSGKTVPHNHKTVHVE